MCIFTVPYVFAKTEPAVSVNEEEVLKLSIATVPDACVPGMVPIPVACAVCVYDDVVKDNKRATTCCLEALGVPVTAEMVKVCFRSIFAGVIVTVAEDKVLDLGDVVPD